MSTKESGISVKTITETAIMAALICVLGPLSVPVGPVPVSLAPFAIFLTACVLGEKKGTAAVLIYLLLGLVGLPVFSGFTGGPQKLFGPTGGFLAGYILAALTAGWTFDHFRNNLAAQAAGCLLALAVLYAFGTVWLMYQAHLSLANALQAAVLPFIGLDILKIAAAILVGKSVRAALERAHILPVSFS